MIAQAHQQALQQHGFGVYVHWPFCLSKCPYCDFNSHVRHGAIDQPRYVRAFAAEMKKGVMSDTAMILMHNQSGQWSVTDYIFGPTDVYWLNWANAYDLDEALFTL